MPMLKHVPLKVVVLSILSFGRWVNADDHMYMTFMESDHHGNTTMATTLTTTVTHSSSPSHEDLQCFHCTGTYAKCGRKQRSDDKIKTCGTGRSCIVGRYGGSADSYTYFRGCYKDRCGRDMEELYCMRAGRNLTCQMCCSSSHCNEESFNHAAPSSTGQSPQLICLALLVAWGVSQPAYGGGYTP